MLHRIESMYRIKREYVVANFSQYTAIYFVANIMSILYLQLAKFSNYLMNQLTKNNAQILCIYLTYFFKLLTNKHLIWLKLF